MHRNWSRTSVPNVVDWAFRHSPRPPDLVYLDSVVQGFWLDTFPGARSVLRVGDRMAAFDGFSKEMGALQVDLARRVDLVIYSAADLANDVRLMHPKRVAHIPNGVDVQHFSSSYGPRPPDIGSVPRPIAIYVGAMDVWFDFEIVDALADALPDVSFVLIGPDELARRRLRNRRNVHLLGTRPYRDIPAYLHHADVGLIPFDVRGHAELVAGIHPLKLYEYFAAGLPVVATEWTELVAMKSPAILCRTIDEHVKGVRQALDNGTDVDRLRAYANTADWKERLATLLSAADVTELGRSVPPKAQRN